MWRTEQLIIYINNAGRQLLFVGPRGLQIRDRVSSRAGIHHLPFPSFGPAFGSPLWYSLILGSGPAFYSIPPVISSRRFPLEMVCGGLSIVIVGLFGGEGLPIAI